MVAKSGAEVEATEPLWVGRLWSSAQRVTWPRNIDQRPSSVPAGESFGVGGGEVGILGTWPMTGLRLLREEAGYFPSDLTSVNSGAVQGVARSPVAARTVATSATSTGLALFPHELRT